MRLRFFQFASADRPPDAGAPEPPADPTLRASAPEADPAAPLPAVPDALPQTGSDDAPIPLAAPQTAAERPISPESRFALLIGNGRYADGHVANPVHDVRLLDWGLKSLGFQVTVLENAALDAMLTAIIAFAEALDAAGADAVAFVYYAGHGLQQDGVNYLIPADAQIPSVRYLSARAMSVDVIFDELARTPRKANVVVIDACRVNAAADAPPEPGGVIEALTRRALPRPTLVIYSTAADQPAEDGAHDNGPFAEALIEELPSLLTPGRRIQDAFDDAAARVTLSTAGRQTPAMYREGVLPPLSLTAADAQRLKTWSRRPRRWSRRRVAAVAFAGIVLAGAATAAALWWGAYPETRTAWLLKAGLKDPAGYDVTCAAPWDGARDRYGLTRRDWCLQPDLGAHLVARLDADVWDNAVAPALAEGDPKAVVLSAMRAIVARFGAAGAPSGSPDEAGVLADRAANTDVPLGKALPLLAHGAAAGPALTLSKLDLNFAAFAAQIADAADHGLLWARIAHIQLDASPADPPEALESRANVIDAILATADRDDASGAIAFYGSEIFGGRAAFSRAFADRQREQAWLAAAADKGWPAAAEEYLQRDKAGAALLPAATKARLVDAVIAGGGPPADYWGAMRLAEQGHADDQAEILSRLSRAAEAGYTVATEALADRYLAARDDRVRDVAAGLALLRSAAARGSPFAWVRLGLLLIDGLADADGTVQIPPDPDEGRRLLERADQAGDIRATVYLADALRFGPLALRDPAAARRLYAKAATALPLPELSLHARREVDAIDRANRLRQGAERFDDPTIGPAQAAVEVVLYLTPSCLDCDALIGDGLRAVTRTFLNQGNVRFVLRIVAGAGQPNDIDAAVLAQCVPATARYTLLTKLIAAQAEWSGLTDPAARDAAFERLSAAAKLSKPSVPACLADPDNRAAVAARQAQAEQLMQPPIGREPIAFVNGRPVYDVTAETLEAAIRSALPSKFVGSVRP